MPTFWTPARGWRIREIMDAHELREQVQTMPMEQLEQFAQVVFGPPVARARGEACRKELAYRQLDRVTPFR